MIADKTDVIKATQASKQETPCSKRHSISRYRHSKLYSIMAVGVFAFSVVWNMLSPLKSWYLGRYGFTKSEVTINRGMKWTTEIDYGVAAGIYNEAKVDLTLPEGASIRFVNMYLDFMNYRKATDWAAYVGTDEDDVYGTRYCRSSLRSQSKQAADVATTTFKDSGMIFWDQRVVYDYLMEEDKCDLGGVAEAMMCLKGYNASDLINLGYKTFYDPADPMVHAALVEYQAILMPDLPKCLARRQELVTQLGKTDGLNQLARELADEYDLDLKNRAGERKLFLPFTIERGFIDLSGSRSGRQVVQFTGNAPIASIAGTMGPLHAIREVLWICTYNLPTNMTFGACLEHYALAFPGFWAITKFPMKLKGTPPGLDQRYTFQRKVGNVSLYQYTYDEDKEKPIEYLPRSTLMPDLGTTTAYRDFIDKTILNQVLGNTMPWPAGFEYLRERCYVRDGCFSACKGHKSEQGLRVTIAYDNGKSGCDSYVLTDPVGNDGFISDQCYGIGKGKSHIMFTFLSNLVGPDTGGLDHVVLNDTADPFEILACWAGGRVPSKQTMRVPPELPLLMQSMPNTIITQTFTRGSEEIFMNFYAVIALVGCLIFAGWIVYTTVQLIGILVRARRLNVPSTTTTQLLSSMTELNISSCTWERYHHFLRSFGLVSVMAWYIGAVNTKCSWFMGDLDVWNVSLTDLPTIEPVYICHPGDINGPFASFVEIVRLCAASYTVYALVFFGPAVRGLSRTLVGTALATFFFGLLPTIVISSVVTAINRQRMAAQTLESVHNQLFVTILWLIALCIMRLVRNQIAYTFGTYIFPYAGICRQQVTSSLALQRFVPYGYFVTANEYQETPTSCVPLSVLLESQAFVLDEVDLVTHRYKLMDRPKHQDVCPPKDQKTASKDRLQLEHASEFYVQF